LRHAFRRCLVASSVPCTAPPKPQTATSGRGGTAAPLLHGVTVVGADGRASVRALRALYFPRPQLNICVIPPPDTQVGNVTYWRMQLHPAEAVGAVRHTVESLAAGYIGLDFAGDIPDLMTITQSDLPSNQRNYWGFAHEMDIGDRVLLFAHHYPFALARVSGPYNYIRNKAAEIGVWFRHFRRVDDVRYYGDFVTNPRDWERLVMTATITPLRAADSGSVELIDRWLGVTTAEKH